MTEEYFRKTYPDSCYGDRPLSPHWDFFQDGVEFGERQSEKQIQIDAEQIRALQKQNGKLTDRVAELEKENAELKTEKIPQLERRIASIRGSHRVDAKKLNARTEQVERLKKEVSEVRQHLDLTEREWGKDLDKQIHFKTQLTKAKEIIKKLIEAIHIWDCKNLEQVEAEAEQFLKENA